jgi:hypothetical protein
METHFILINAHFAVFLWQTNRFMTSGDGGVHYPGVDGSGILGEDNDDDDESTMAPSITYLSSIFFSIDLFLRNRSRAAAAGQQD